ncbi:MAG: hypothetical protein JXR95_13745 [Deltaproteobacteria bacterium]|nr:hypothetical protein [Deltaproteobacteria bacterium]
MVKIFMGIILGTALFSSPLSDIEAKTKAKHKYTCHRYVKGVKKSGKLHIWAYSKKKAEVKAVSKFRKMGKKTDYAKCKY